MNIEKHIDQILKDTPYRITLSKPMGDSPYQKITFQQSDQGYYIEKFTPTQTFHERLVDIRTSLIQYAMDYKHFNALTEQHQISVRETKKGKVLFNRSINSSGKPSPKASHNREKKYILQQGTDIQPLVDIGVFTPHGDIVKAKYNKFKQINRFIELIDDAVKKWNKDSITVLDFGCGKSYLTFIMYYYFTQIKKMKVHMVGLDLKEKVIEDCNAIARRYGYEDLHFEIGNIHDYTFSTPVDLVVSLHACDIATDYALYSAIQNNVKMIFSVPCCQHELNTQIQSETFHILTRHGIVKERIAALFTDAIRSNLLEVCGYKSQIMEFVDISHTPKNLLIRANKASVSASRKRKALDEVHRLMKEYNLSPTLYNLLQENGMLGDV